jgi:hypothetical protein
MDRFLLVLALGSPFLALTFVSFLADVLRQPPTRLFAILAGATVVGLTWYLGWDSEASNWLAQEGHLTYAILGFVALLGLAALIARAIARRRFHRLRWPAVMAAPAFQERCMRYLGEAGWTIEPQSDDRVFRALKGTTDFQVQCVAEPVTPPRLVEITRPQRVLMVAARPIPVDVAHQAALSGIRLIHYRQLDTLDTLLSAPVADETPTAWAVLRQG